MENKTKLFIDMDGVCADFIKAVKAHPDYEISVEHDLIDQLDVFGILEPMPGAIDAITKIWNSGKYVYCKYSTLGKHSSLDTQTRMD